MRQYGRPTILAWIIFIALAACSKPMAVEQPAANPTPAVGAKPTPPAVDPAGGCPKAAAGLQLLTEPEHGYCLLYPADYKVEKPKDNETVLVIGGLLNAGDPRVHILVEPALGRTVEVTADDFLAEFLGGANMSDFGVERRVTALAGTSAVLLDHLPGQDFSRRVIAVHNDMLYQLIFSPLLDSGNQRLEALFSQIVDSLAFFPTSEQAVNDCLAPTAGEHLFTDEAMSYCLLLPDGYRATTDVAAEVHYFPTAPDTGPRLAITHEPAAGRSGPQAAEELLGAFPSEFGVLPVGGVTVGYEPAGRLDNVPGDGLTRVLTVAHDDRLYSLTFIPAAESFARDDGAFEALYELVIRSFRFLVEEASVRSEVDPTFGVSLLIDPALAERVQASLVEAVIDEGGMGYTRLPRHVSLTFPNSYAVGQPILSRQQLNLAEMPQVVVYPVSSYSAMVSDAGSQIALLQRLLAEQPAMPGGLLPYLPLVNAAQVLASRVTYVSFQNGTGLRYLTALSQEVAPVTNRTLFYTFQGLTSDGEFYVAAFFPVTTPALPDSWDGGNAEALNAGYPAYQAETKAALNSLDPDDFTPGLALLDRAVASLLVEPSVDLGGPDVSGQPAPGPTEGPVLTAPPTGMVYRTYDAGNNRFVLNRVDAQGEPTVLLSHPYPALPSPDAAQAAYVDDEQQLWLVDLVTGEEIRLAEEEKVGSFFSWADSQTLLVGLLPSGIEAESAGFGQVAILDIVSGDLQLVDEQHLSFGRPFRSPDGQTVAYDAAPFDADTAQSGWLFSVESGVRPFTLADFSGPERLVPTHVFNPTWSPDGRLLTWLTAGTEGNRLVVVDLLLGTALTVHLWQPAQFGALPPTPVWSPDSRWLALEVWSAEPGSGGLWVLPADGTFARLHAAGGSNPVWLNGSQLIYADLDGNRNGPLRIYDLEHGDMGVLELPAGAVVLLSCASC